MDQAITKHFPNEFVILLPLMTHECLVKLEGDFIIERNYSDKSPPKASRRSLKFKMSSSQTSVCAFHGTREKFD